MSCFSNSEESELYLVGSRDTSKLYKQSRVTHSDSFPRMFTKTLNKVRAMTIPETLESSCSDPGFKWWGFELEHWRVGFFFFQEVIWSENSQSDIAKLKTRGWEKTTQQTWTRRKVSLQWCHQPKWKWKQKKKIIEVKRKLQKWLKKGTIHREVIAAMNLSASHKTASKISNVWNLSGEWIGSIYWSYVEGKAGEESAMPDGLKGQPAILLVSVSLEVQLVCHEEMSSVLGEMYLW